MCRVCGAGAGDIRAACGGQHTDRDPGLGTLPQHSHRNRCNNRGLEHGQRIGGGIRDCWPTPGTGVERVWAQLLAEEPMSHGPCLRCVWKVWAAAA